MILTKKHILLLILPLLCPYIFFVSFPRNFYHTSCELGSRTVCVRDHQPNGKKGFSQQKNAPLCVKKSQVLSHAKTNKLPVASKRATCVNCLFICTVGARLKEPLLDGNKLIWSIHFFRSKFFHFWGLVLHQPATTKASWTTWKEPTPSLRFLSQHRQTLEDVNLGDKALKGTASPATIQTLCNEWLLHYSDTLLFSTSLARVKNWCVLQILCI